LNICDRYSKFWGHAGAVTIFGLWNWFFSGLGRTYLGYLCGFSLSVFLFVFLLLHSCVLSLSLYTSFSVCVFSPGSYLAPSEINFRGRKLLRPRMASKSEIAVTYIRMLIYYSTLIQTNVSLLESFRDHYEQYNPSKESYILSKETYILPKRALYAITRDLYSIKRALYFIKRAPYSIWAVRYIHRNQ